MNVEIWSDIACPFCYIGKRKFEDGLQQFPHRDEVDVTFKSFQLDPYAEKEQSQSTAEMLADKYGMSLQKAEEMNQQVTEQAKEVGLDYQLESSVLTNTKDAHRLSHFAREAGKMEAMMERLLKAYFTEGKHVGDHDTLAALAEEVGLDGEAARAMLESDRYEDIVREEMQEGADIGVQGVPFFVFNRKYAVSGAQPPKAFLEVMEKVHEEESENKVNIVSQGESCTDETC
ncbi:DsbA family oxidoreductase [Natribacillus halophilus]|uniref:Predicted dithiol-disulfide isomerase, DsbA family n=1 Tax=Natribacillus halophilus TaxID=549003 RepID=A0A1G8PDL8_9BACI|nr:DsbA family oxidoreductase [Natribacillus halophilus]SDI90589.1 Predicted dithiol-disulfide isomerase, DsbA family [Natribacillus halophilus]